MTKAQEAVLEECGDDFRYVLMRFMRFAIGLLMRVYMVYFLGMWAKAWFMFGLKWRMALTPWHSVMVDGTDHWFLIGCAFITLSVMLFGLDLAVAIPYRYKAGKPGLAVRTCGKCGVTVPDTWTCGNCKSFRQSKVFSSAMYAASVVITAVFVVHDVFGYLFGMGMGGAGGGGGGGA